MVHKLKEPIAALEIGDEVGTRAYPDVYCMPLAGRLKRRLADVFGIKKFSVNMTELKPGAASSEFHFHTRQDEFVHVLEGEPTLVVGQAETILALGHCIGFTVNSGIGHMLANRTEKPARVLEIGNREPGDECHYPRADFSPLTHYPDDS
ncbi:cupin domain-containing protein [Alphaproteobacteria bacterium]|jgi:uncharacterized cupin superfamily protein|nr:cupin domain-containing protein [Alphaproteobacteria bacterium]